MNFLKGKSSLFYIQAGSVILLIVGAIFFAVSYTTGYNQIVYGEDNSVIVTVLLAVTVLILAAAVALQCLGKEDFGSAYNIVAVAVSVLLMVCTLLLLADRVDAIGNCIVAPWDAGYGGEDSCYLSFVSMGCWLVALIANIVGSFIGYRKKY